MSDETMGNAAMGALARGQRYLDNLTNVVGREDAGVHEAANTIRQLMTDLHHEKRQHEATLELLGKVERGSEAREWQLVEALTKAADTFRAYERLHRAKETAEGNAKADANARTAAMCEAALSAARGTDSPQADQSRADSRGGQ